MRTIRVTGKGKISVKPDLIRLDIDATGVYLNYEDTIRVSAEQTRVLKEYLEKAGLNPDDLKTTSFDINSAYESYYDEKNHYKQKFIGYEFRHETYIKFENDNEILGKVLYQLSKCPVDVTFDIIHTISNTEEAKNELLRSAVEDAKIKSRILADSSEVTLGDIISIDYSWSEVHFTSHPIQNFKLNSMILEDSSSSYDIDIEADDIDMDDTVTVIWEIK